VSRTLVAELLNAAGYSLQANRKTKEGDSHPDRDTQFARINTQVATALAEKQPVISVTPRKRNWSEISVTMAANIARKANPEAVRVHDFLIKELGRAVPYGVYDLAANSGWVSVGVDHDTAAFAVNSIRQWWQAVGRTRYPDATRLLITADGGRHNGSRCGCGNANSRSWPTSSASTSWSATCRPQPASGTKSNTASSLHQPELARPSHSSAIA